MFLLPVTHILYRHCVQSIKPVTGKCVVDNVNRISITVCDVMLGVVLQNVSEMIIQFYDVFMGIM